MIPIGEVAATVIDHAAIIRDCRAKLAALDQHANPLDVPLVRWRGLIRDSRNFIDQQFAMLALELDWTVHQLWACHPIKPFARIDCAGLLWLVNGDIIDDITEEHVVLLSRFGVTSHYWPRPAEFAAGHALPWELLTSR